jgi:hypothetical protein
LHCIQLLASCRRRRRRRRRTKWLEGLGMSHSQHLCMYIYVKIYNIWSIILSGDGASGLYAFSASCHSLIEWLANKDKSHMYASICLSIYLSIYVHLANLCGFFLL